MQTVDETAFEAPYTNSKAILSKEKARNKNKKKTECGLRGAS